MANNGRVRVDAHTFIEVWQTSSSITEVARLTGMSKQAVRSREHNYRTQRNISLKKYESHSGNHLDWNELERYARSFND